MYFPFACPFKKYTFTETLSQTINVFHFMHGCQAIDLKSHQEREIIVKGFYST